MARVTSSEVWTRTVALPGPLGRRGLRVRVLDASVAGVIVVVLLVLALVAQLRGGPAPDRAALERDATALARAQVLGLTTLDRKDAETVGPQLRSHAAASYRDAFDDQLATFTADALAYGGLAEGRVLGSRVVFIDDDSAEVRVTCAVTTTRRRTEPVDRRWSARVLLVRQDDRWLVSGLTVT